MSMCFPDVLMTQYPYVWRTKNEMDLCTISFFFLKGGVVGVVAKFYV